MLIKRTILIALLAVQARPAGAVDNAEVTRDGAALTVTWHATQPVDVFVADQADATPAAADLVARADRTGRLTVPNPGSTRRYFLLREAGQKTTVRIAERLIPLIQGSNFRDIGGYPAAGGKHVRWGLIYRSGATPLLTETDIARVKGLGLKNIVDLRSSEERVLAPTRLSGIRYTAIDYPMMTMMGSRRVVRNGVELYRNFPSLLAPQLRIVFDELIHNQGPLVYHCSAGQDRTGFTTAMVLSALGVSRPTITSDYYLSTSYRQPQFELPKIDEAAAKANPVADMFATYQKTSAYRKPQPLTDVSGGAFLDGAFAEIDARWGSVDAYLESEVGVTKDDLARMKVTYLE